MNSIARARLRLLAGLLFSALFMALAARKVDWARVFQAVRQADGAWLLAGIVGMLATYVLFAGRWRMLARGIFPLRTGDAFKYIMIGYLANMVMPLRLGDVSRGALAARESGARTVTVLATMALERLLDIAAILLLAVLVSWKITIPEPIRLAAISFAWAVALAFFLLISLLLLPESLKASLLAMGGRMPDRSATFLRSLVRQFKAGIGPLMDAPRLLRCLAMSLLAWLIFSAATLFFLYAFDFDLPWPAAVFVVVVVNLGSAIPSSPGFIGVYHYLVVLALSVWAIPKSEALGYALATHGLTLLFYLLVGGGCLWNKGIRLGQLASAASATEVSP
jgi:glycosyltransferase 2 family protein